MSDGEDEIIAQYMESLDDDEAQNHKVQDNQRRQHSTIRNISAMQNNDLQVCNPIFRARDAGAKHFWDDYFAPNHVYPLSIFCRHFQMNRGLFNHILTVVCDMTTFLYRKKMVWGDQV